MNSYIPAGLIDNKIEFFLSDGELMVSEGGITTSFSSISIRAHALLKNQLDHNPIAKKAIEMMGITDPMDQLYAFAKCRYADINSKADLSEEESNPEYYDCGHHGNCSFEGLLCVPVLTLFGKLTNREIRIIKLIADDLPDKLIAARLSISYYTLRTHIKHIEDKIGAFTKVGVTCYACQNHIV